MRRREVDVGVGGIGNSASLSVGVVGDSEFVEVGGGPGVDGHCEEEDAKSEEDDEAAAVGALSILVWVRGRVQGMGPS